jgi:hypothetical protein
MLAETIVPIGSFGAVGSVVGIILLVICLLSIAGGKAEMWGWCLTFAFCNMFLLESCTPDPFDHPNYTGNELLTPYIWYEGKWQNEVKIMKDHLYYPEYRHEQPWEDKKIYKMNYDLISPRVFQPDCLYLSPLTACGIALLCSPFWMAALFLGSSISTRDR